MSDKKLPGPKTVDDARANAFILINHLRSKVETRERRYTAEKKLNNTSINSDNLVHLKFDITALSVALGMFGVTFVTEMYDEEADQLSKRLAELNRETAGV